MSQINGKAKRFNGEPVDYVLIFDWVEGKYSGKAVPDASGNWSFDHYSDITCGITYVADGCEPITHGAYSFSAIAPTPITSGYLLLIYAATGNRNYPYLDKTRSDLPTWASDFSQVVGLATLEYAYDAGSSYIAYTTSVIEQFNKKWVLELASFADTGCSYEFTLEVLNAYGNSIFAIKASKGASPETAKIQYGESLNGLAFAVQSSSVSFPKGELSFTDSSVVFTQTGGDVGSFVFSADITKAYAVRVSGLSENPVANAESGGWFKILRIAT